MKIPREEITFPLQVPRGTSFPFLVKVYNDNGEPYRLRYGDILIFGVKHYLTQQQCVITKTRGGADYDSNYEGYVFTLEPSDTKDLAIDTYKYDVSLQTLEQDLYPVIPTSDFEIKGRVTSF